MRAVPKRRFQDQTEEEKAEARERYRELLEELRTVVPGVQVLFAFLLTGVFSQRFSQLDALGERTFAAVLICAALAAITLMSPAAVHRVGSRHERAERLAISVRMQVAGMCLLLLSMSLAVFVVARLIFDNDTGVGIAFGGTAALAGVLLWFVAPLVMRD